MPCQPNMQLDQDFPRGLWLSTCQEHFWKGRLKERTLPGHGAFSTYSTNETHNSVDSGGLLSIFLTRFDTADAFLWLYHPIIWRDDNLESAQASNIGSCFYQIWPCRSCAGTYRGSLCHVNVWAVVPKFQTNVDRLNAWQHFPALELYNYIIIRT